MIRTLKGPDIAPELLPEKWEQEARALLAAIPEKYDQVLVEARYDTDLLNDFIPPTKYQGTALVAFLEGRYAGFMADKPSTISECMEMYLKKIDYCFSRPFCKPCGQAMKMIKPEVIEKDGVWYIRHTFQCPECKAELQQEKEAA